MAAEPTATGTLEDTPFCELLVYALSRGLTGSLVLECPNRSKHAVAFAAGSPVKARVDDPSTRLGAVLFSLGWVDAALLRAAEAGPETQLFGQRLLERGAIDESTLAQGLGEQLAVQLAWLSRAPVATGFAYFDRVNLLERWGKGEVPIDPLAAIWRAVDAHAPSERVERACHGLAGAMLRLHPASRVGRFGLSARERPVLDVLRMKPQTLAELEATGLVEQLALHKLLYALALTRHLDTGQAPLGVDLSVGAPPPSSAIAFRRPSAARRLSHSKAALPAVEAPAPEPAKARETGRFLARHDIEQKLAQLDTLTHYELLELPEDIPTDGVSKTFPTLARLWHPDRLSPQLLDLREAATRIFARMTEAARVLGNPVSRAEYDRTACVDTSPTSEQAQVERVLRAAEAFQKAEIMLKKRDVDSALEFARAAFTGDPAQPEYAALYAWIRARRPGVPPAELEECLSTLQGAVGKQPENVKVHYYLACVLKLCGKEVQAMREFRLVAERDPNNVEAARELRLYEMRRQQAQVAGAQASPGLLGRFFKR